MNNDETGRTLLESAKSWLEKTKRLGEGAITQLDDSELTWRQNVECNSIAVQIQHLSGSTLSRWTDPLTTDGCKRDRDRDAEFIQSEAVTRDELMDTWNRSWECLFESMDGFEPDDLHKKLKYKGREHTLLYCILLQLHHASYHVGQIVQIAKECKGEEWNTLSIPRAPQPRR